MERVETEQAEMERVPLTAAEQAQHQKMTGTPVPKLVIGLGLPTIASMLVTALYNVADTYFVSQLGTSASGAVGIVFSLMAIIQAIGFMLGTGCASLIARRLGARDVAAANRYASSAFFAAIACGLVITITGTVLLDPLMRLLGATKTILPYARAYGRYILFGAPFMCTSFVMNNILRCQGKAALSMIGLVTGGFVNILLDPIFIFVLGLGTAGAAIATLISQFVGFSILLFMFLTDRSTAKLGVRHISREPRTYLDIVRTGLPALCRQGLASVAAVLLNTAAGAYTDAAVAAMSIVSRIFSFIMFVGLGIGQGMQPVVGFNYGAKRFDRTRDAYRFAVGFSFIVISALSLIAAIFAPDLFLLFRRDDPRVVEIGALALRAQCAAMLFQPVIVCTNMSLQATGRAGAATFLALSRQGILFIPLILILPRVLGLPGIQFAQPIADVLMFSISVPFTAYFFRHLKREEGREGGGGYAVHV